MEAAHCNGKNGTTETEISWSERVNWYGKKKESDPIGIRIKIEDEVDLIGNGVANEEHLERVAKHDSSVIPLVDASLHDFHVVLHSHLLPRSDYNPNSFLFWLGGDGRW